MNTQIKYSKKYQFYSEKKKHIISLKSLIKDNLEKLEIKLTINDKENTIHFYNEKSLEEIHHEYAFLGFFTSIKPLIDYLGSIIKKNNITISKINRKYKIEFNDKSNNRNITIILERKIDINEKAVEDMKGEIKNLFETVHKMENQINNQNLKYNELQKKYVKLQEKYDELLFEKNNIQAPNNVISNSKISNISKIESINSNPSVLKDVKEFELIISNNYISNNISSNNNSINHNSNKNNNNGSISQQINEDNNTFVKSHSIYKSEFEESKINENKSIFNNKSNNESKNSEIQQSLRFFKENNCEIEFTKNPSFIQQKYIINKDQKDEVEYFVAFNNYNNNPIIAWLTKKENKTIYFLDYNTKDIDKNEKKIENAHNAKINMLQYYYNDNSVNNNEYIISLSRNDNETVKIWNLEYINGINLKLIRTIKKKISYFCFFSNKLYSSHNNYLVTYNKNDNHKIISFWKLDNDLNILEDEDSITIMETTHEVNYLDIFYYIKNNELYLINCNNKDVTIVQQPFTNCNNKKFFKKYSVYLSAFIIERNNNLELFEANMYGISIWDYNNESQPKKEFLIGPTFDLCLWNLRYIWASTNIGFKLIDIEEVEDGEIKSIMDENNKKIRNGSKIRKIITKQEHESIIGIDSERQLCLWT